MRGLKSASSRSAFFQRRLFDLAPLIAPLLVHVESEMLRHVAIRLPIRRQFADVALFAPVVHLEQCVDGLVEQLGALVGQLSVVEVDDQQQPHHERAVHQRLGLFVQSRAAFCFQPLNAAQQVVRALGAQGRVVGVNAGIGLAHHRRDVLLEVERLHGDLAEMRAQRRAPAAVGDGAAGDHDAQGLAPAYQFFHRLTHLGALVLVRHFVQPIQQQEHVPAVLEQFDEEVGGEIEVGLLADQVVRDEIGQGPLARRCVARQVAAVTREGGQRYEEGQRQFVRLAFLGLCRLASVRPACSASSKGRDASAPDRVVRSAAKTRAPRPCALAPLFCRNPVRR